MASETRSVGVVLQVFVPEGWPLRTSGRSLQARFGTEKQITSQFIETELEGSPPTY